MICKIEIEKGNQESYHRFIESEVYGSKFSTEKTFSKCDTTHELSETIDSIYDSDFLDGVFIHSPKNMTDQPTKTPHIDFLLWY